MIKNKGNIKNAIKELKNSLATSHLFENATFNKGILNGAVFTIKDVYANKNSKVQASSKILENFWPNYDATIIKKIKNAGAAIVANVHLDELALGGSGGFNAYSDISKNPLNKKRMIGGSSSGSVYTFTKNISVSIGSDTGDSVRLPASYNGFYGFKPSYGAISRYGLFPYASSLDTVGYFTHNIEDAILTSNVLYDFDENDMSSKEVEKPINKIVKMKKVGFIKNANKIEEYLKKSYKELKQQIKEDGIEVLEFSLNKKLIESIDGVYQAISYSEVSSNDSNLSGITFGKSKKGNDWNEIMINSRSSLFGPLVQKRLTIGSYFLQSENINDIFYKAQKVRRLIVDEFNKIKKQVDILIFPATKIAPLINEKKDDSFWNSYLIHANLSGTPSITIPWKKHNGMPFSLVIDGLLYEDKKLLSHSLYIEKLLRRNNE